VDFPPFVQRKRAVIHRKLMGYWSFLWDRLPNVLAFIDNILAPSIIFIFFEQSRIHVS